MGHTGLMVMLGKENHYSEVPERDNTNIPVPLVPLVVLMSSTSSDH